MMPPQLRAIDSAGARPRPGRPPAISRTGKRPGADPAPRWTDPAPIAARLAEMPQPRRRIYPRAVASAVQLADLLVVLAIGFVVFDWQSTFHWPLGWLPASAAVLVLALMART